MTKTFFFLKKQPEVKINLKKLKITVKYLSNLDPENKNILALEPWDQMSWNHEKEGSTISSSS